MAVYLSSRLVSCMSAGTSETLGLSAVMMSYLTFPSVSKGRK